ncbi:sulfatase [candidate division CSSED10-310 bacterium]|uniref:Sulfatase n=1 Tax=candidate division CSSED10-310 bacterium TaxID=2855610 RepID=A0ABV6Z2J9_UNCC1
MTRHTKNIWLLCKIVLFVGSTGILLYFVTSLFTGTSPEAIFLIMVDTVRPDHLSCYGYKHHSTVNIDHLAEQGVKFTRAQSVSSWTRPSVGAIMTSKYPSQLGLVEKPAVEGQIFRPRQMRAQERDALVPLEQILPNLLKDAGFQTAAFVNQPSLCSGNDFQRWFQDYYYPVADGQIVHYSEEKPFEIQDWGSLKDAFLNDHALVGEFGRWLRNRTNQKVFVWLHLLTPHRPYLPPRIFVNQNTGSYDPALSDEKRDAIMRYDGEIKAADFLVGEIMKIIAPYAKEHRSLIVFTSDHGEELWDHGNVEHGHSLHREVLHVPLIMVTEALPKGKTIDQFVRTIDILPTILDLAEIKVTETFPLEGVSLKPMIQENAPTLPVFSEGMLYGGTERSLIEQGYKLMFDEQLSSWNLFDLNSNAAETINLAPKMPDRTEFLRQKLLRMQARLGTEYQTLNKKYPRNQKPDDQQNVQALKALGYISE